MNESSKAYAKGYLAGRKRKRKDEIKAAVRNQRFTDLTAAIISAGINKGMGVTVDGEFRSYTLQGLEKMAEKSAYAMTMRMDVFE